MKAQGSFVLGGIFLVINGAAGGAIPDFYTDEDLNAWHNFGLRSFFGPWSVIARKPNGDFVSYADYGARLPSGFRPISPAAARADEFTPEAARRSFPSEYAVGISDFATGFGLAPYGVALLANGPQSPRSRGDSEPTDLPAFVPNDLPDEKNFGTGDDLRETVPTTTTSGSGTEDDEGKRETLELIGIVGVVSEDDDSAENDGTTVPSLEVEDNGSASSDRTTAVSGS